MAEKRYGLTVQDLLAVCEELVKNGKGEFQVVMAKDSEGNGYSPLSTTDEVAYVPYTTWAGELDNDEDPNALVLWPIS